MSDSTISFTNTTTDTEAMTTSAQTQANAPSLIHSKLPQRKSPQLLASLISVTILSAALLMLWLGSNALITTEPKIQLREVNVMQATPPPPPPPSPAQPMVDTPMTVQIQGAGPAMQMADITPTIEVIKPMRPELSQMSLNTPQFQSLEVDWQAFDLNELDGLPTALTQYKINFPKSLSRRGINKVLIKLDVIINEQGKLTLVNILENPHPELTPEILRLIRISRFSAPKKDNELVRARFIWPVRISS